MNTSPQPDREKEIFEQALDLPSAEARLDYVKDACGDDTALLARVQTLLRAHEATGGFLPDNPGAASAHAQIQSAIERPEKPGSVIGRYKLLQELGEGGCGIVYMAEQEEPVRRRVALKVIKLGMDTKEVVARFEAERQALAMMDHPNIARVFDGGSTPAGRPFFVMELVRGMPITQYCDETNLPTERRLELFAQVCQAVQHAHQKGIIHRDLKPSNVLVTENDGVPVPKVIDFGIAKATQGRLTDQTLFTAFEQFIGTPAYMSPEQAAMTSLDIDTRSDIYSLGILLYELLTGRTPFDARELLQAGLDEMRRHIREIDPPRPSTRLSTLADADRTTVAKRRGTAPAALTASLAGDLDWIVMKALEKDRSRRYETASALALDLQRYRENQPVTARPPSTAYTLQKLIRRHKVSVAAGTAVAFALVAGLCVSMWAYFNEKAARQFAVETSLREKKASDSNRTIMIRAADNKRRADASDKQASIDAAKASYAMAVTRALLARESAPTAASIPDDARQTQLDSTVTQLHADTAIPPEAKWDLCETFGDFYFTLGKFERAEALYSEAVRLRRDVQGEGNPDTSPLERKLIETLKRQGKDREARKAQFDLEHTQAAFLRSSRWIRQLKAEAQDLQARGQFAKAETKLLEAAAVAKANPPDRYDPLADLGSIAWLRFDAGDYAGARQLARHWLDAEKTARRWTEAGPYGFFRRTSINSYTPPFDAHTILGLIALHEGDRTAARFHLLNSVNGVTRWTELDWRKLKLATALAAVGETNAVSRFLVQLRPSYIDARRARTLENALFGTQWSQFYNAATGEAHAEQIGNWQLELSDGKVPADWERMRGSQPLVSNRGPALLPVTALALPPALSVSQRVLPLFPFGFLMLGWCAAASAQRLLPCPLLTPRARRWLFLFCALRTLDCALFVGPIIADRFQPPLFTELFISFFGWVALWLFLRELMAEERSRWERRSMRALIGFGVVILFFDSIAGYTSDVSGFMIMIAGVVGSMVLVCLTLVVAFGICILAAKRIWQWQRTATLDRGRRFVLKLAVPLLVAHGWVSLFAGSIHTEYRAEIAGLIFWANALIPWLLAFGFSAGRPSISPASTSTASATCGSPW